MPNPLYECVICCVDESSHLEVRAVQTVIFYCIDIFVVYIRIRGVTYLEAVMKPNKKSSCQKTKRLSPFEKAVKLIAKENYQKEKAVKEEAISSFIESKKKLDHL